MRILFVTLCSIETNSSAMIRNNSLIKGLAINGSYVDILTVSTNKNNPFLDTSMDWNWEGRVNIIKLKGNSTYNSLIEPTKNFIGSLKKTLLPIIRWIYHSFSLFDNTIYIAKSVNISTLANNYYDIVISSSDPKSSHVAVDKLLKQGLTCRRLIQYWGDPLANDINKTSILPRLYLKIKEKKLFSCADNIVYVSPFTLKDQKKIFPKFAGRMHFIPIPYLKKKFYNRSNAKKTTIGYFGDYTSKVRNILPLYETCKKMQDNFELLIAGNSDLKINTFKNIAVFPRISQEKVEELEASCDILVSILNKTGKQIPGKIYHFAATNRPILVILDGDNKDKMRQYLEKFNRYIFCENDEESILEAITGIKNNKKEYYPSPYFEPERIAKMFLDL